MGGVLSENSNDVEAAAPWPLRAPKGGAVSWRLAGDYVAGVVQERIVVPAGPRLVAARLDRRAGVEWVGNPAREFAPSRP